MRHHSVTRYHSIDTTDNKLCTIGDTKRNTSGTPTKGREEDRKIGREEVKNVRTNDKKKEKNRNVN